MVDRYFLSPFFNIYYCNLSQVISILEKNSHVEIEIVTIPQTDVFLQPTFTSSKMSALFDWNWDRKYPDSVKTPISLAIWGSFASALFFAVTRKPTITTILQTICPDHFSKWNDQS
jgi:hypothetical protein